MPHAPRPAAEPPPLDGHAMKGKRGLQRLLNAARYSADGLAAAWRHEDAFRQEVALAAVMIPVALLLRLPAVETVLLIGVVVLVLIVELLNSGIEALADAISAEHHPLLGRAKDLGSAAVMLSILLAVATWGVLLLT